MCINAHIVHFYVNIFLCLILKRFDKYPAKDLLNTKN